MVITKENSRMWLPSKAKNGIGEDMETAYGETEYSQ